MCENTTITEAFSGINELWKKTKGSSEVRIAVLDGPVDLKHDALKDADITSLDTPVKTKVSSAHGTFVSSLIFANHNSGIQGIAPDCSGIVKSIYHEDNNGNLNSCSQSDIEQGILMALEQNVDIINISGGEKLNDEDHIIASLAHTLKKCEDKGVLVIAATGNEGDDRIDVPASYPTVLAIGSIKNNGEPSNFSNWSKIINTSGLVAPGENIIGAIPSTKNDQAIAGGTSFSTAIVSGVAALLASLQIQQGMEKDLLSIRSILLNSVTPCSIKERINCDRIMTGRLNINNAMSEIISESTSNLPLDDTKLINKVTLSSDAIITTKPENSLILNNINMKNQTEVTPSATTNNQTDIVVEQATPSITEDITPSPQIIAEGVAPSAVEISSHEHSKVVPSEVTASYNPANNPGGYPTFKNSQLVNAIGQPSYDFGTQNNLDTFSSLIKLWYQNLPKGIAKDELTDSPHDHKSMAAFLLYKEGGSYPNIFLSSQLIWLMNKNSTPIYSISPQLASFNNSIYLILAEFLAYNVGINPSEYTKYTVGVHSGSIEPDSNSIEIFDEDKENDDLMRMVLPGFVSGKSKLINGNYVESVTPVAFGLKNWTLNALVKSLGITGEDKKQLISILNRLYVSTSNRGQSPDDRALNYSLYNILELSEIVKEVVDERLQLSNYKIVPSKIARQNSIVREIQLIFFNPKNTNEASTTYSMQVDVSGVTPVMIGEIEKWYAPVSVTSV